MPRYKDNGAIDTRSGGTGFITHAGGVLLYGTGDVGPNGLAQLTIGGAGQMLRSSGSVPFWHDGGWNDITFNAGNFNSDVGTWVVGSSDQVTYAYARDFNREIKLMFTIGQSTITGTPNYLAIAMPLGLVITKTLSYVIRTYNSGIWNTGIAVPVAGESRVRLYRTVSGLGWANETDLAEVHGVITVPV